MDNAKVLAIVERWIDRQLAGEIPNVIGSPGEFPIQTSPTETLDGVMGVGVICKGGEFWLDDEANATPCQINKGRVN